MLVGTVTETYQTSIFGFDHINRNAPVLIRTPKLTRFEPAQYWGGGPPGNSAVLNPLFQKFFSKEKRKKKGQKTCQNGRSMPFLAEKTTNLHGFSHEATFFDGFSG